MFIFVLLIVGFSGLIVQVLLLRELLVSFYGNELTVGIILANWVFLEAVGALLLGKLVDRISKKLLAFVILNIIFIFSSFSCLYLARTFKVILNVSSGLGLGIDSIFWSSFLILLPVSFIHGGLFSFCAKIYAASANYAEGRAIGQVYFWETIGAILGGVIFTYFFIPHFDSFRIASVILFLNFIMLYFFYPWPFKKVSNFKKMGAVFIASLFFLFLPVSDWLQNSSIKLQWHNQEVVEYANSIYGNVVTTRQQEQYTFFIDGLPAITSPYPDITFVQEFAQLPLLFHSHPRYILFISGGVGGLINEILKNPGILKIDYVELDPLILKMVKKYPTPLTERELNDLRVNVLNLDGRFFVKNTNLTYDLIFLGLSLPSDLQTNRLFTEEFFEEVRRKLTPGGILTFTLPGSSTYLSQELKDLNACILNSLNNIFPYVRVIPGDFNLFLASDSPEIMKVDSYLITRRIRQRQLTSSLLLPDYIEYRLHPRWSSWFNDSLKDATKRTNRDFCTFAIFKTLSLWNAQFSPRWQKIFLSLGRVNFGMILVTLLVLGLLSSLLLRGKRRFSFSVPYAIVSTGFFGMLINLIIVFSFQIVYGYLYHQIAILITVFMAGAALGSILIGRYSEEVREPLKLLFGLELGIIFWIFITLFIILSYPPRFIFFILCAVTGFWVGIEFPLANKVYLKGRDRLGETVGVIYAADLFGGWLAAILSGILFLPILGLVYTCLVIFIFKLISLILLAPATFFKLNEAKLTEHKSDG